MSRNIQEKSALADTRLNESLEVGGLHSGLDFVTLLTVCQAGGGGSHQTAGEASRFERGNKEEIGEQRDRTCKGGIMTMIIMIIMTMIIINKTKRD